MKHRILALLLILCAVVVARADDAAPHDMARVIYWHNNAAGSDGGGWGLYGVNGWAGTLEAIKVASGRGIKTAIIRAPEGDPDSAYPLDFYVPSSHAPALRAAEIRAFVHACRDILGVEVIPYFGSLPASKDMAALVESGDVGGYLWRVMETVKPWTDAGCKTLAFDQVGAYGLPDDPSWGIMRAIDAFPGINVLGEPHGDGVDDLSRTGDELSGCVVNDAHWRSAWKKADFREQFKGRVIRITSSIKDVQAIIDDGHEAAVTWAVVVREMEGGK